MSLLAQALDLRCRDELFALDDSGALELMDRRWKPTDWPREPRQSPEVRRLVNEATRLIEEAGGLGDEGDVLGKRFSPEFDSDVIVLPFWCHLRDLCEAALDGAR